MDITVELPFDPIGSVIVPAISILVSAGIAILVVHLERRAARRDRIRAEIAQLSRELTELVRAGEVGDIGAANAAKSAAHATLNTIGLQVDDAELAVVKYINGVLGLSGKKGLHAVGKGALFASNALEAWVRGKLRTSQFADALTTEMERSWTDTVKLSDWANNLE